MENLSEPKYRQPEHSQASDDAGRSSASADNLSSQGVDDEATSIHHRNASGPAEPVATKPYDDDHVLSEDISEATIISNRLKEGTSDASGSNVIFRPTRPPKMGISGVMAAAQVLLGKSLDHFELLELVGGGGMGAVFRSRDTRLDRIVAVKVIPAAGQDPEMAKRFKIEAQSAARLDHPNIARVYYVGEVAEWSYIVFEYVDGINLRDLVLSKGPLSVDEAVWFTRQVAEALTHAAARFVVHRDIKPSNVLVTKRGLVKLVDMGLARTTAMERTTNDLTASNVTLGTFDYISPEQARDPRAADVRSDLYSLGCTLYFLLSGKPPFPNGSALEKLMMHGNAKAVDLRELRFDVSPELALIVKKLMEKNPSQRYQEPIELINDLYLLAEFEDLPKSRQAGTVSITPTIEGKSVFESLLPWMVAVGLLCAATLWMQNVHRVKSLIRLPREQSTFSVTPTTAPTRDQTAQASNTVANNSLVANSTSEQTTTGNTSLQSPASNSSGNSIAATPPSTQGTAVSNLFSGNVAPATGSPSGSTALKTPNPVTADQSLSKSTNPRTDALPNAIGTTPNQSTSKLTSTDNDAYMLSLLLPDSLIGESDTGTADLTNVAPHRDTVIIVDAAGQIPSTRGWKVVRTLQEAMMIAAAEQSRNQVILMNSIDITSEVLCSHPSVTIRSGGNQRAKIQVVPRADTMPQFKAESQELLSGFSLEGQSLQLVDVDISLQSPESSSGLITCFRLSPGSSVKLIRSTLTMQPSISDWRASAFSTQAIAQSKLSSGASDVTSIAPRTMPLAGLNQEDRFRDPVRVMLKDSIVRGNGEFLHAPVADRIEVQWVNGLLAIDGRFIDYRGASYQGRVPLNIRLLLNRVTAMTQRGFSRLRFSDGSEYPVCLSCTFESCAFVTDADAAFYEFEGVSDLNAIHAIAPQDRSLWSKWLDVRGSDNAYDTSVQELIRLRSAGKIVTRFDFEFAIRHIVSERAPESDIRWISAPSSLSAPYRQTPEDYLQRPGMFQSGMESKLLPMLKKTENSSSTEG